MPDVGAGDWKTVFRACETGDLDTVKHYLRGDADVYDVDLNFQHAEVGSTPLIAAIRGGFYEIVVELIEQGNADINLEAEWFSNGTPLDEALIAGQTEIADFLKTKGAIETPGRPKADPGLSLRGSDGSTCAIV
mmetsp:Transcript_15681/g.17706  ORF Transcript_15681/g.17706 Transcript_15681/m.17706 type:complete len:134 (+) Transcript_15681:158-559(+)|eukprot:CAMPEP_0184012030 /NCGR_PEP_ID=MMETSP0954-20121128/4157_1 /TAXON_ID=627963 /ORGANISM="Aplanochytrium sp, Strain PBS07" /LENGTH=133 /DNA_ID=CAMNT_0026291915 /DNA_START=207 /DNA_END=608 /DNA_ORIENTATION=+